MTGGKDKKKNPIAALAATHPGNPGQAFLEGPGSPPTHHTCTHALHVQGTEMPPRKTAVSQGPVLLRRRSVTQKKLMWPRAQRLPVGAFLGHGSCLLWFTGLRVLVGALDGTPCWPRQVRARALCVLVTGPCSPPCVSCTGTFRHSGG